MNCSKCGAFFENAKFCPECGAKTTDEQNDINDGGKAKKNGKLIIICGIFVLLIVIGIIAANILICKDVKNKSIKR